MQGYISPNGEPQEQWLNTEAQWKLQDSERRLHRPRAKGIESLHYEQNKNLAMDNGFQTIH